MALVVAAAKGQTVLSLWILDFGLILELSR
jgi:hypothetical protein